MATKSESKVIENIQRAIYLLSQIAEDRMVPRNIRSAVVMAKEALEDRSLEINIVKDKAIQILGELHDDPNMPIFTRTQIWNVLSLLENI